MVKRLQISVFYVRLVHLESEDRVKFGPKAPSGRLVGYGSSSKVHRVALLPDMMQIIQSHNVIFDEDSVLCEGIYYQNRRATSPEATLEVVEELRAFGILSDPSLSEERDLSVTTPSTVIACDRVNSSTTHRQKPSLAVSNHPTTRQTIII